MDEVSAKRVTMQGLQLTMQGLQLTSAGTVNIMEIFLHSNNHGNYSKGDGYAWPTGLNS